MLKNVNEIIGATIKEGTTLAILDNKISSKEKHEKYFSGRWFESVEEAENIWNELVANISKVYNIEMFEKEYPAINRKRRELTIKEVIL